MTTVNCTRISNLNTWECAVCSVRWDWRGCGVVITDLRRFTLTGCWRIRTHLKFFIWLLNYPVGCFYSYYSCDSYKLGSWLYRIGMMRIIPIVYLIIKHTHTHTHKWWLLTWLVGDGESNLIGFINI